MERRGAAARLVVPVSSARTPGSLCLVAKLCRPGDPPRADATRRFDSTKLLRNLYICARIRLRVAKFIVSPRPISPVASGRVRGRGGSAVRPPADAIPVRAVIRLPCARARGEGRSRVHNVPAARSVIKAGERL